MKKLLSLILILLLCVSFVGCNTKEAEEHSESNQEINIWWNNVEDGSITEEHIAMFEKALDGVVGISYSPTKLIATQIVSGTKYKFLCEETVIASEIIKTEKYVTIYRDLERNCTIEEVEDVEEKPELNLAGWTTQEDGTITETHTSMFEKALSNYVGASFKPIKLIATQVVSGVNYKFLCEKIVVGVNISKSEVYVTIYRDLEGNCTIVGVE